MLMVHLLINQTAIKLIRNSYDMGYDFFDTAEAYIGVNSDGTVSYNEETGGRGTEAN